MNPLSHQNPMISRPMTLNNAGVVSNANVNGAVTTQLFSYRPAQGVATITRMMVTVRDAGVFTAEKYGFLSALSNGCEVGLFSADKTILNSFTGSLPIKENAGWGVYCYDVDLKDWGAGDEFIVARWTFAKAECDIRLYAGQDIFLGVLIQDDLTGLVDHRFVVQGYAQH